MKKIKIREIRIFDIINKNYNIYTTKQLIEMYCRKKNIPNIINIQSKLEYNKYDYFTFVLKTLFDDYELIDCQNKGHIDIGHPDYLLKGEEDIYIELKNPRDSIRPDQLLWIFKNPDKKTLIICLVANSNEEKEEKKLRKETQKAIDESAEFNRLRLIKEKDERWKQVRKTLK